MSISAANSRLPDAGLTALRHFSASAFLANAAQRTTEASHSVSHDAQANIPSAAWQLDKTSLPGWVNEKMEKWSAHPDQKEAMEEVEIMATRSRGPLVAIWDGPHGIYYLTYTYTGELVTPESSARYAAIEEASIAETGRIFAAEKANGASAANIFEKIEQHMATLPEDYLRILNWHSPTYAQPT
jgi:hypothetical protein